MTTLNDIAVNIGRQFGRIGSDGLSFADTDDRDDIYTCIGKTVTFYARRYSHLVEVRDARITTVVGQTWYNTFDMSSGAGEQDTTRTSVDVNQIVHIDYMRERPGASGLNEPMREVPYRDFQSLFEGSSPGGDPSCFARYAGEIGVWPTPAVAVTLEFSAHVKPVRPVNGDDTSVFFAEAEELVEAAAARRYAKDYLQDYERAQAYAVSEMEALQLFDREALRKRVTGRIRAHD